MAAARCPAKRQRKPKAEDIELARAAGYAAAIVVDRFPSKRAFLLSGSSARVIPCPAESGDISCARCRLCIDRDLLAMNAAIAFEAHGGGRKKVVDTLVTLGRKPKKAGEHERALAEGGAQ